MSSQPLEIPPGPAAEPASIDQAIERVVARYRERGRVDMGPEIIRAALRDRLMHAGFTGPQLHLMEVNLLGNLSGWIEFILEERSKGKNMIPDFARHLRTAFFEHCREHKTVPDDAVAMAIELATAIMELASAFRRQFSIASSSVQPQEGGGE